MKIFGFEIRRPEDEEDENVKPFAVPVNEDGAINIGAALGNSYGHIFNMDSTFKSESDLVTQYRTMSMQPEVAFSVDNIVNEAISIDEEENIVKLILDDVDVGEKTKARIYEEFDVILKLLNFSNNGYDIFHKWYVDGRLNFNVVIDEKNFKRGIVELIYVDPRKLRFVQEMMETPDRELGTNVTTKRVKNEYYLYNENGFSNTSNPSMNGGLTSTYSNGMANDAIRIAKDSVVRVPSGLVSEDNSMVLSHLHKAIKPLNLLRSLEDANVIYTITRAPERRIFYIDVGNLPTNKAEQYLHNMMVKHKNKVTYDNTTGQIADDRRFMTMTQDYWFPRREGSRSTEIETLPGAGSLSDNDQLEYFKKNLYQALSIPASRFDSENTYSLGRATEMSREEVNFGKFVRRLRAKFSVLFDRLLEKQLILKGVIAPDEWKPIQEKMRYDYMKDNYFEELKSMEILREKIAMFQSMEELIGKHFSTRWAYRKVMFMGDDEMDEMRKEIDEEKQMGYYEDMSGDTNIIIDKDSDKYVDGLAGEDDEDEPTETIEDEEVVDDDGNVIEDDEDEQDDKPAKGLKMKPKSKDKTDKKKE